MTNPIQRILVGVIFIPLIIILVFIPWLKFLPFTLLILGIVVTSAMEYQSILKMKWMDEYKVSFIVLSGLMAVVFYIQTYIPGYNITEIFLFLGFCALALPQILKNNFYESLSCMGLYLLGLFLIPYCFSHIILIINMKDGIYYILMLLFMVWFNDISAYAIGVGILGNRRHKIPLKVSPNKSYEGYIGAFLIIFVTIFLVNLLFKSGWTIGPASTQFVFLADTLSLSQSIIMALIMFFFINTGDLVESVLKRSVNIKDSSHFIPGHGGILDRFDAFFLAVPAFYFLIKIFKAGV